jgi:hypothetical protein
MPGVEFPASMHAQAAVATGAWPAGERSTAGPSGVIPAPEAPAERGWVIVHYPTIMDGPVVRWYASGHAARQGRELVSVSKHGVMISESVFLHEVEGILPAAREIVQRLKAGEDCKDVATHATIGMTGRIFRIADQEYKDGEIVKKPEMRVDDNG